MSRPYLPGTRITEIDAEYSGPEGVQMMRQAAAAGIAEACADEPEADLEAGA